MTYSVKYKRPGQWFFRTIKNLKGDTFVIENGVLIARLLVTENEERYEIPLDSVFVFDKNRFFSIKINKEEQTGQKFQVKTKAKPN